MHKAVAYLFVIASLWLTAAQAQAQPYMGPWSGQNLHMEAIVFTDVYNDGGVWPADTIDLAALEAWPTYSGCPELCRASDDASDKPTMVLQEVEDATVFAADGTKLGQILSHRKQESLVYRRFGARSILNTHTPYGHPTSPLSPFNPCSMTPPTIVSGDGRMLGYLTANRALAPRIDPGWLVGWLQEH